MRRFVSKFVPIQGYGALLACLTALGCGGDSSTQTPPATGAGTGGGAPVVGATSGAGGTPTGAGGSTMVGTPMAGTGRGAAGRGTATGGTGAAPTAGTGTG